MRVANLVLVLLIACGSKHRGEPKAPELQPRSTEATVGERMFRKFCYQCHPGGAAGLGPALNDKPLPEFAIRLQIRKGVGAMPAFDDDWLTDEQVAAIAEYVQDLRSAPKSR